MSGPNGKSALDGRSILVTGGSGFIGTNLIERLRERTDRLLNIDVARPRNAGQLEHWQRVDILDREALTRAVRAFAPEILIHLAARTDLHGESVADYAANTEGVRNMLDATAAAGTVEVEVYASSRLVFEITHRPAHEFDYRPTTAYGASKVEGEKIVRSASPDRRWILVRPTSIWGPWFDVPYRDFFDAVLAGRYVHPAGRRIEKSYGFVGNTVHEIERLVSAPSEETFQRVFWLADYPPLEVRSWAAEIRSVAGRGPVRDVPVPVLSAAAAAGDVARRLGWREPPLTRFRLANLMTPMVYDLRSLEHIAGPLPFSMAEGTRLTIDWLRGDGSAGGRNGGSP